MAHTWAQRITGAVAGATLGVLLMAGCSTGNDGVAAASAETATLAGAMDLTADEVQAADDTQPATDKGKPGRGHKARAYLRKNTLHGEATVKTDKGTKTVVFQRGTITAVDDKQLTVKSEDGYTVTWTFGDPLRVADKGQKADKSVLKTGVQVGVAGEKTDAGSLARLVVIPKK